MSCWQICHNTKVIIYYYGRTCPSCNGLIYESDVYGNFCISCEYCELPIDGGLLMKLNILQTTEEYWTHFYIQCPHCGDSRKIYGQIDDENAVCVKELGKYVCLACSIGWIFQKFESKESEVIINSIKRSLEWK